MPFIYPPSLFVQRNLRVAALFYLLEHVHVEGVSARNIDVSYDRYPLYVLFFVLKFVCKAHLFS